MYQTACHAKTAGRRTDRAELAIEAGARATARGAVLASIHCNQGLKWRSGGRLSPAIFSEFNSGKSSLSKDCSGGSENLAAKTCRSKRRSPRAYHQAAAHTAASA